jgi:hypothetical protein
MCMTADQYPRVVSNVASQLLARGFNNISIVGPAAVRNARQDAWILGCEEPACPLGVWASNAYEARHTRFLPHNVILCAR